MKNFLPKQYKKDNSIPINHNYLQPQYKPIKNKILKKIDNLFKNVDFTLGKEVDLFEKKFSKKINAKYAIGVGSGTDALFLSLKAVGIKEGDEVITTAYTFYATVGAIATSGAKPVFVDIKEDYNIDEDKIEKSITKKTKAIVPVHWTGRPCNMDKIMHIAKKHNIHVIEDACHAYLAKFKNKYCGNFGTFGCFSFHPLKNLNVGGDGGMIVTNSKKFATKIKLLRNHGLVNRDKCKVYAYNSRLDSIQAIIGNEMIKNINFITKKRISNSHYLDLKLNGIKEISFPNRNKKYLEVFHLYIIKVEQRSKLQKYLISNGIDAKVHYKIPMHLQPASNYLNYKKGDFPLSEKVCKNILSLPVHEYILKKDLDKMVKLIKKFYS